MEDMYNQTQNEELQQPTISQDTASQQPQVPETLYSPYQVPQPVAQTVHTKPVPETKKKKNAGKWIASIAVVMAIVLICCSATAALVSVYWNNRLDELDARMSGQIQNLEKQVQQEAPEVTTPQQQETQPNIPQEQADSTPGKVYADNVGAVVAISNEAVTTNIYGQVSRTASSGSGFIVSADGYVVTNFHVVEGATTLRVITLDAEYEAELIGYDSANDLAVLKIAGNNFPCVKLGSSDTLRVGDQVMAIGNPLGELTSTLTVGYISAKDRKVSTEGAYLNMLQTDAAINSGNSGGPLFNANGEVVGITTAKYSGTSGSGATIEGIGFAIPIDDVKSMIDSIIEKGYVSGAYLGVMARDMDQQAVEDYTLPQGAYIDDVLEGSCAETAGIQAKDIIIKIGEYDVTCMNDLSRALREYEAGDTETVVVYRNGQEISLQVTFDERPQEQPDETEQETETPVIPDFDFFDFWFGGMIPGF